MIRLANLFNQIAAGMLYSAECSAELFAGAATPTSSARSMSP